MKDIFISDLSDYVGKEVSITVLLKDITLSENRSKAKWLEIIASDKSGEVTFRIWEEQINDSYFKLKGKVVKVLGMVSFYQGKLELQVVALSEEQNYDWKDFVLTVQPNEIKLYCKQFNNYIERITDTKLKALVRSVYSKARINKISYAIGGTLHHNYFGGLLVHTVETCAAALKLAEIHKESISPYKTSFNEDLLIAGALLHDVGKLNTYGGFPDGERTERGLLVGSTVDSVLFATVYNSKLDRDYQVEDLAPLNHIILTAESMDDKGTLPRTLEAIIVNEANRESVKMDGFVKVFNDYDRKLYDRKKTLYSRLNKTTILRGV